MKTKLLFLSVLLFAISEIKAQVTLPWYEGFDYTIGESIIVKDSDGTTGLGPWRVVNNTGTTSDDPLIIASPAWTLPAGLPSQTGAAAEWVGGNTDPSVEIPDQGSSGFLYASFMLRITNMDAITSTTGGFLFSFYKVTGTGSNSYTSTVYIKRATNPANGTFYLGVGETNSGSSVSPAGAATGTGCKYNNVLYSINTDYFIVISYDIANQTSYMWINPTTVIGAEPAATIDTSHDVTTGARNNITYVRISAESNANTPTTVLDEIRVGNSWADVTSNPPLSVSKNELQNGISLYPNPAKDYITINAKENLKVSSVEVFTLLGQKVLSQNVLKDNRINVANLSKGIYLLKIAADGNSITKKMLIE